MLKEAFEFIADLATGALKPVVMNPTNDPRTVMLVKPDGSTEVLDIPPALHKETLFSIGELARFVKDEMGDHPLIYVAFDQLTAVYDKHDRRDFARCELSPNEQWLLVNGLKGKEFGQREFWKLLRVGLDGCLPDTRLLDLVKEIKFNINDSGGSTVGNANHAMGRQLVAAVQGTEAIPESVTITVPAWDGLPFRAPIRCALDANPDTRTFSLTPFPNQIDDAENEALTWLLHQVEELTGENVPAYLGKM